MTNVLLKDALERALPNGLPSKVNFDNVEIIEKKKPEIPVSGTFIKTPSSAELDKNSSDEPILSHSPNLYKQSGDFVSSQGYICVPRSLKSSPEWQELKLKQRHVFETLLFNVRWSPQIHRIGGKDFVVGPAQLYITIRQLQDLCNKNVHFSEDKVDLAFVQRTVSKFFMLGWIDTKTDTGKTLFTITYPELYDYFNSKMIQEMTQVSIQDRYTNEERKEREEIKGTNIDVGSPLSYERKKEEKIPYNPSVFEEPTEEGIAKITEEQFKEDFFLCREFCNSRKIPLKDDELERWIKRWSGFTVIANLQLMTTQKTKITSPGGWMEKALRGDWAKLKKNEPINRKFAEEFKNKNNWGELCILKKYCSLGTHYDLPLNFDPELFRETLESKFNNLYRGHDGETNY